MKVVICSTDFVELYRNVNIINTNLCSKAQAKVLQLINILEKHNKKDLLKYDLNWRHVLAEYAKILYKEYKYLIKNASIGVVFILFENNWNDWS